MTSINKTLLLYIYSKMGPLFCFTVAREKEILFFKLSKALLKYSLCPKLVEGIGV